MKKGSVKEQIKRMVAEEVQLLLREGSTFKYEGGRAISRNGKPFIYINRSTGGADPTEADAVAHLIAELLDKADFDAYYKRYMKS